MIDIYDEVGYIKEVLENGISEKWERDSILLIRYYKSLGDKKSEVKEKIKKKCENNKAITHYDHYIHYDKLNKIIDNTWKKDVPLREIKQVEISQEVLDWFLGLEDSFIISKEEEKDLKERRPKVSLKNCHPINWKRTKYLFTLYIWTRVQENYLDRPNIHYLKKYAKRFKEDADLPASFNMQQERNLLYDLGFIEINYALGIDTAFMKKYNVFKVPVTEENRVIISGEDLYRCGYWLEKQKMGSFVCERCGKEFAHYNKSNKEKTRKYCKECAKSRQDSTIKKVCIDCGKEIEYDSTIRRIRDRCPVCQAEHEKELHAKRMQRFRESKKVTV